MTATAPLLPSPCVGVCVLDERTGWCLGCGRNGDELFGWGELSARRQEDVWAALPARMAELRRPVRLLPWSGAALLERLFDLTPLPGTVWSLGVAGAAAEFLGSDEVPVAARHRPGELLAVHPGGALRLRATPGLRGFVHEGPQGVEIVLALHEARVRTEPATRLVELGLDRRGVAVAGRTETLFDLGLACARLQFAVRTAEPALLAALRAAAGRRALDDPALLERLVTASPTRVVRSPIGRIEVTAPIAAPGTATPESPHTHLYPTRLQGPHRDVGVALPPGYVAGARVYTEPATARALDLL